MPIDSHHHEYDEYAPEWECNEDVVEGEREVKAGGETYLPRLPGQDEAGYKAYLQRAAFFPATSRTRDGLLGMIFRKDPQAKLPPVLEAYEDDIDMAGTSLDEFAARVVDCTLQAPHGGILVEYPRTDGQPTTAAQADALGMRPYATYWEAEDVFNWATGRVNNRTVLTEVRLSECVMEPDPKDPYTQIEVKQIRQLRLNEAGLYEVVLFREKKDAATGKIEWIETDRFVPYFRGKPETAIPFVFIGPRDTSPECSKAPLSDIASVNVHHYHNSADYENGLFWIGTPTPVFIGDFVTETGETVAMVKIGATSGIHMSQGSDAKFLEFQGSGLEALKTALADKKDDMAILGARILAADKKAAETAETAAIHRAGENSVLASLANAVSKGIENALKLMAKWAGDETSEISYRLNTDYQPVAMSFQDLTATVSAWQAGALSETELFEALQAGEVIRDDKTFDDHKAETDAETQVRDAKKADQAAAQLAQTAAIVAMRGKTNG